MAFDLGDYVTVAERIEQFREKYPNGSLQSEWQIVTIPTAVKQPDGTWKISQPVSLSLGNATSVSPKSAALRALPGSLSVVR